MSAAPESVMDVAELCHARDLLGYTDEVLAVHLWTQLKARRVA